MSGKTYFTPSGLKKVRDELNELKTVKRPAIAKEIDEAREKGDLRENAEYHAAKEAQGHLETKIAQLEGMLANAVVVDESKIDTSRVVLLSKVKVKNLKTNKTQEFTLVPENEADFKSGKISMDSPVGKGLIGKEVGDVAEIQVPAGKLNMEILDISMGDI